MSLEVWSQIGTLIGSAAAMSSVGLQLRERWEGRPKAFLRDLVDVANLDPAEFVERVSASPEFQELLL